MTERAPSAVSIEEFLAFRETLEIFAPTVEIDELAKDWVRGHIPIAGLPTRPGGYVPGPTMMGAVDYLGWLLVFSRVGITPMAVTWDLSINFLRPAVGADVIVEGTQTKFGTFSHATYALYLDGSPDRLVAHATTTYAVPKD